MSQNLKCWTLYFSPLYSATSKLSPTNSLQKSLTLPYYKLLYASESPGNLEAQSKLLDSLSILTILDNSKDNMDKELDSIKISDTTANM